MRYTLLSEEIPFYTPIEQIFSNRGIPLSEINHYKNVSIKDTHSPELFENIEAGVSLLVKHLKSSNKTGILVDCDTDGFTSAALLYNYLYFLFPNWASRNLIYFIHEDKQHGLSDSVDKIVESGVKLIIVPDAGSGDGKYAKDLKEKGIDTLIIDHHHIEIQNCEPAIVINNQLGAYPNQTLSGVGVVYKFCQYIDKCLTINAADNFLDLVAVGCVADLMPLTDYETLYYIREGLKNIKNPFIKAMVSEQSYSISKHGGLDPYAVGFYIAPFINATIRVGNNDEKLMLFQALLDSKGNSLVPSGKRGHKGEEVPLAEEACRICANVKSRQTKLRDDNLIAIEKIIEEEELLKNKIVAVRLPKELGIDKNILGLIANILMDKYQRPILLLNETEEEIIEIRSSKNLDIDKNILGLVTNILMDKYQSPISLLNETGEEIISDLSTKSKKAWAGSARNYQYSEIEDFRKFLEELPQTLYAEGHANAFGVAILDENFDSFIEQTNELLKDIDFSPVYRVDAIFNKDTAPSYILDINDLKPYYGQGFEAPYIAFEEIKVDSNNLQLMSKDKNPTLKITLDSGIEFIKFKSSEEEYNNLLNTVIDIVGTCSANIWYGKITPQVIIEDYSIKRNDF